MKRLAIAALIVGGMLAASVSTVQGATVNIEFTKIADTSTINPSTGENFTRFGGAAIDGETVVFWGDSGGPEFGKAGVYTGDGASLNTIADTTTAVPGGVGNFKAFRDIAVVDGKVAFQACGDSCDPSFSGTGDGYGIYFFNGTNFAPVADPNIAIPDGTGNFETTGSVTFDGTNIVFWGDGSVVPIPHIGAGDQRGIYTYNTETGALETVVNQLTSDPSGQAFVDFSLEDSKNGKTVFESHNTLYLKNTDGLSIIADQSTPIPDGNGTFTQFLLAQIDGDLIAFTGNRAVSGEALQIGIYLYDGLDILTIADTSTLIPGGIGTFESFDALDFDSGAVSFLGRGQNGQTGLYAYILDELVKILAVGDVLNNLTVLSLSALDGEWRNGNSFAFQVGLDDGSVGIYRADISPNPVPIPAALPLLMSALGFFGFMGWKRKKAVGA